MKQPNRGITRRGLGIAFAAAPLMPAQQPTSAVEDLTAAAREQRRQISDALRKFNVPIATEPSFTFHP